MCIVAFPDPQSVTIAGTAISLPLISREGAQTEYKSADGATRLSVQHSGTKRFRRTARITTTKTSADPLVVSQNVRLSASVYVVLDVPVDGYTATEQTALVAGLTKWLTDTTNANTVRLVGGES